MVVIYYELNDGVHFFHMIYRGMMYLGTVPLEIIDKGKQGYYFRHNDVDDLCRMLRYIIKHYEEALQLSDKAQTFVTVNFDSKLIAQQYINLYNEYIYKTHTK